MTHIVLQPLLSLGACGAALTHMGCRSATGTPFVSILDVPDEHSCLLYRALNAGVLTASPGCDTVRQGATFGAVRAARQRRRCNAVEELRVGVGI